MREVFRKRRVAWSSTFYTQLMSIKQRIAAWYRGRPIGNGQVVHIGVYRQHWTSQWAHRVVGFGQRYWAGIAFVVLLGLLYALQGVF